MKLNTTDSRAKTFFSSQFCVIIALRFNYAICFVFKGPDVNRMGFRFIISTFLWFDIYLFLYISNFLEFLYFEPTIVCWILSRSYLLLNISLALLAHHELRYIPFCALCSYVRFEFIKYIVYFGLNEICF